MSQLPVTLIDHNGELNFELDYIRTVFDGNAHSESSILIDKTYALPVLIDLCHEINITIKFTTSLTCLRYPLSRLSLPSSLSKKDVTIGLPQTSITSHHRGLRRLFSLWPVYRLVEIVFWLYLPEKIARLLLRLPRVATFQCYILHLKEKLSPNNFRFILKIRDKNTFDQRFLRYFDLVLSDESVLPPTAADLALNSSMGIVFSSSYWREFARLGTPVIRFSQCLTEKYLMNSRDWHLKQEIECQVSESLDNPALFRNIGFLPKYGHVTNVLFSLLNMKNV